MSKGYSDILVFFSQSLFPQFFTFWKIIYLSKQRFRKRWNLFKDRYYRKKNFFEWLCHNKRGKYISVLLLAEKIHRSTRAGATLRPVSRNVPETMDREGATNGFMVWRQRGWLVRQGSGQDHLHFLLLDTVAR